MEKNSLKKRWSLMKWYTIFPILLIPNFAAYGFPIYAQQAYSNPREANGRIVCANCHLAQKPIEIEAPQSVLPDQVFEVGIKIPYEKTKSQILGNGKKGGLNLGAILILPEGFKVAPKSKLSPELVKKTKSVYIAPYSQKQENILVVGPVAGELNPEITFPILSPNPATNKKVYFVKYPLYAGGNRGRGQLYPDGQKTNNNIFLSSINGKVTTIESIKSGTKVEIEDYSGNKIEQVIPSGLDLIIKLNDGVRVDQPLNIDPNVGGFGQAEDEVSLQNPVRILSFIGFSFITMLTQTLLVLKKKQYEKVQTSEMNF